MREGRDVRRMACHVEKSRQAMDPEIRSAGQFCSQTGHLQTQGPEHTLRSSRCQSCEQWARGRLRSLVREVERRGSHSAFRLHDDRVERADRWWRGGDDGPMTPVLRVIVNDGCDRSDRRGETSEGGEWEGLGGPNRTRRGGGLEAGITRGGSGIKLPVPGGGGKAFCRASNKGSKGA